MSSDYPPPPPPLPPPPPAPGPGGYGVPAGPPPNNWLVPSILATIFCCLPFGIVGIVFAAQVNSKWAGGDVAGANDSAAKAKLWTLLSAGVGVALVVGWLLLVALGIASMDVSTT